MVDSKLQDLIGDYTITLNGINAEVYRTSNGVLLSNNDFLDEQKGFEELHICYAEFKKELIENEGKFITKP